MSGTISPGESEFEPTSGLNATRSGHSVSGFHDGEGCPGCGKPIKGMKFKGKNALSLNAFIYRDHGVLIAYMLCGKCARYIFRESEKDPLTQTPLHDQIEKNLKQAFLRHGGH
jgi:hypothetical protein